MTRIPLTHRKRPAGVAIVDDADAARLSQWSWRWNGQMVVRTIPGAGRSQPMHREIMGLGPGDGLLVDHQDGDRRNNQRANLRLTTHAQNGQNLGVRRDSQTGVRGVSWDAARQTYRADVKVNGKGKNLGRYATIEEAALVVASYRREHMTHTNEDRYATAQ